MKLESYIQKNRNRLDVEKPDEGYIWAGISQAINTPHKRRHFWFLKGVAAASVLLILSLTFIHFFNNKESRQPLIFTNIDPVLASQEVQFKNQIEAYSKLIKHTSFDASQLATSSSDIQYIDDLINYYSKDLKLNGSNPKLINSLMDLYQKKIMLLERMLNEIEKSKDHEKRKIDI